MPKKQPAKEQDRPVQYEERRRLEPREQKYKICGADSRRLGRKCERPAGWGTDHVGYGPCKLHGGTLKGVRAQAHKTMIMEEMQGTFGANMPVDIHPTDALLELVKMTAGYVRWLNKEVGDLASVTQYNKQTGGKDTDALVRMLGEYTDRLARFSKMALDAGVEERMVRLAEQQGDLIAIVIVDLLDSLNLTVPQREVAPQLVREALGRLSDGEVIEAELVEETSAVRRS